MFAVHGVGGALGILLTAFFAADTLGGMGLAEGMTMVAQFGEQLLGLIAVGLWAGVISWVLVRIIDKVIGLRVTEEDEIEGLDITSHGERIHLN